MTEDLDTLLELLKDMGRNADPEIMKAIREHGSTVIDPLLAIAIDPDLNWAPADDNSVWAPIHAVELLSDLRIGGEVISRLFDLLDEYPDNDWLAETIIRSMPRVGESLIEPALAVLRDHTRDVHTRNAITEMLGNVAKLRPGLRERIADSLVRVISDSDPADENDDDRTVNGFIMCALEETRAVKWIPFIKRMFRQGRIDTFVVDLDWMLDSIQGKDPMKRLNFPGLDDDFLAFMSRRRPGQTTPLPTYVAPKRPGRNDPCWCGSGKKYKKCHMREDRRRDRRNRSR